LPQILLDGEKIKRNYNKLITTSPTSGKRPPPTTGKEKTTVKERKKQEARQAGLRKQLVEQQLEENQKTVYCIE
jgi:hypothetical protein